MNALNTYFAAGCFGGLINGLFVWMAGKYGLTAFMGVDIAPEITAPWLYQRIIWGGLWGFLFFLPFLKDSVARRGCVASIGPSLAMLLLIFPNQMGKGYGGLDLGQMTPLFVCIANAVWGVSAALWARLSVEQSRHISVL